MRRAERGAQIFGDFGDLRWMNFDQFAPRSAASQSLAILGISGGLTVIFE
jgi:hypothetical protein